MNGPLEIFRRAFHSVRGSQDACEEQRRIEQETFELVAIILQARSRNETSLFIKGDYCLDVMRALNRFCSTKPCYHYNKLIGYQVYLNKI